jgi:hypothetical protein
MPMKFDAARATAIFEKLGEPAFTGPNNEGHVADFVAGEFERIGWRVERREVEGSRFPQRAGPWIGWLGYGALITVGYVLSLGKGRLSVVLAFLSFAVAWRWVDALLKNRLRLGRRRKPLETGPLLIGSLTGESTPAVRVVFQSVLGGLKTDFFQSLRQNRFFIVNVSNALFWVSIIMTILANRRDGRNLWFLIVSIASVFFVLLWIMILQILSWEYHQSRPANGLEAAERRGLAVLLELARSWPRNRSRQIEPVFIAAGGQRLDYAGSREVVRILETEWPRKPTLLVLFFAPGAGEAIRIAPGSAALRALAKESAESLWIPVWGDDCWTLFPFWPFEDVPTAETIALIGSDPTTFFDSSVVPEALHRSAQLATEIALRWAKKQREQAPAPDAPRLQTEASRIQGDESE